MRTLTSLAALTLTLAARSVAAQGECPVDIYQPAALAQAGIRIGGARQADAPADAAKALRDAMRLLGDEGRYRSNLVGGGFLKAQIYVLWLHQENAAEVMTLEQLNAPGVKTDKVDLLAAADSLLKKVEAVSPTCATETLQWRQSKPWSERITKAYTFITAEALDSAEYYTSRAAILYSTSPFIHNAYAQIANKKGDGAAMLTHLRAAIEGAGTDTALAQTKRQMQFQLASKAEQMGALAKGAEQKSLYKEALDVYMWALSDDPASTDAAYSLQQAAAIVSSTSDTASAVALLSPMVQDVEPYSDLTLILAGDIARYFGRTTDAVALYEGVLKKNPNVRDANYFLAGLYYEAKKADAMIPLADKLIEIDPSNSDNHMMKAYAYELMAKAEKDVKKKAEFIKQVETWSAFESTMPHRFTITRFERRAEGAAFEATVENLGKVAKAYTVVVDFLDVKGEVVETMTAEVPSLKPKETGKVALTPTKAGIAAYRYQALK